MFKLIVLSAFIALAAAAPKPGLYHESLVASAPVVTKTIVQPEPLLVHSNEHVGSVVSHVPTGVSAYSTSVVHGASPVVSQVVTPVQKTIISEPVVTVAKSFAAPAFYSQPIVSAPIYKSYAAAPAYTTYAHAPVAYSAPALW